MSVVRLKYVSELIGIGRHEGQVHHSLSQSFLVLINVDVGNRSRLRDRNLEEISNLNRSGNAFKKSSYNSWTAVIWWRVRKDWWNWTSSGWNSVRAWSGRQWNFFSTPVELVSIIEKPIVNSMTGHDIFPIIVFIVKLGTLNAKSIDDAHDIHATRFVTWLRWFRLWQGSFGQQRSRIASRWFCIAPRSTSLWVN